MTISTQQSNRWKFATVILIIALVSVSFVALYHVPVAKAESLSADFQPSIMDMQQGQINTLTAYNLNGTAPYSYVWSVATSDNVTDLDEFEVFSTTNPAFYRLNFTVAYIAFKLQVTDFYGSVAVVNRIITDSAALDTYTLSGGVSPGAPSYTIFSSSDGLTYYAKNATNYVSWSSTNAGTVLNNCIGSGSVNIRLAPGSYVCNATQVALKRNTNIEGAGAGLTIVSFTGNSGFQAYGDGPLMWGVRLASMTITGDDTNNGIELRYTYSNTRLENLEVKHFDACLKIVDCYAITVKDSEFNYGVTYGCIAYRAHGLIFSGDKFYGNLHGLSITHCSGASVSECDFEENNGTNLIITDFGGSIPQSVKVTNNYFEGAGTKDIADKGIGSIIEGNRFINTNSVGYAITVERNCSTIQNNLFNNYTSGAVWTVSGSDFTLIEGNNLVSTPALLLDNGANTRYHNNRNETAWLTNSSP